MIDKTIDITNVLSIAIERKQNAQFYAKKICAYGGASCEVEYDNNEDWYTIDYNSEVIGYMSTKYPALFIQSTTLGSFEKFLVELSIPYTYVSYDECVSCEPDILRNYISNTNLYLIDDRFLYDENIPFDYEAFELIDDGARYVNPYCFKLSELREW